MGVYLITYGRFENMPQSVIFFFFFKTITVYIDTVTKIFSVQKFIIMSYCYLFLQEFLSL